MPGIGEDLEQRTTTVRTKVVVRWAPASSNICLKFWICGVSLQHWKKMCLDLAEVNVSQCDGQDRNIFGINPAIYLQHSMWEIKIRLCNKKIKKIFCLREVRIWQKVGFGLKEHFHGIDSDEAIVLSPIWWGLKCRILVSSDFFSLSWTAL